MAKKSRPIPRPSVARVSAAVCTKGKTRKKLEDGKIGVIGDGRTDNTMEKGGGGGHVLRFHKFSCDFFCLAAKLRSQVIVRVVVAVEGFDFGT